MNKIYTWKENISTKTYNLTSFSHILPLSMTFLSLILDYFTLEGLYLRVTYYHFSKSDLLFNRQF